MGIHFQASSGNFLFTPLFANPDNVWQNNAHEPSQHPFCKFPPAGLRFASDLCFFVDSDR